MKTNGMIPGQKLVDPHPCPKLDINDASVSDDKTDREVSISPLNNAEIMSKEHDHHLTKLHLGKQACPDPAEDVLDRSSSQSWGSCKSPNLEESKPGEQVAGELPFRKARVSVRARSEAPLVINFCFLIKMYY